MSAGPDSISFGLDRETHATVVVPGLVLLSGFVSAAVLTPQTREGALTAWRSLACQLHYGTEPSSGLPGASVVASAALSGLAFLLALGLGYVNHWASRRVFSLGFISNIAWEYGRRKALPEMLPHDAFYAVYCDIEPGPGAAPRACANPFYQELTRYAEELAGPLHTLAVCRSQPQGPSRKPANVAADLMAAWLYSLGDQCRSGLDLVAAWRERSNLCLALSTSLAFSFLLVSVSLVWSVLAWPVWLRTAVSAVALFVACLILLWFLARGVTEWANGQHLLCRLFWAAWKHRKS